MALNYEYGVKPGQQGEVERMSERNRDREGEMDRGSVVFCFFWQAARGPHVGMIRGERDDRDGSGFSTC